MLAKICLGLNTLLYLLYSYKFIFDTKATFASYGLHPKDFGTSWPSFVSICRYLGACYFTIAFLMGHTIKTKPSAGIKTAVMINGLLMMLLLYRKFIEDPNSENVNEISLAGTDKNLKILAGALITSLVGLKTVVDPPVAKEKK